MAEETLDLRGLPKSDAYAELDQQLRSVLDGMDDPIAAMSTMSALIHHGFGHLWTGFYRVVESGALLRVGPYQGMLGCLEITFGRGVCGTAAAGRRTIVVADVNAFPGHITCDARSRSEIVVPVLDAHHKLIAVLDIDSAQPTRLTMMINEDSNTSCNGLRSREHDRMNVCAVSFRSVPAPMPSLPSRVT